MTIYLGSVSRKMRTIDGMKQVDISVADPVERIQQYIDSYINDSDYEVSEIDIESNQKMYFTMLMALDRVLKPD